MKKCLKEFFMLIFLTGIFFSLPNVSAKKNDIGQQGLVPIKNNTVTEEKISDNLVRKETISYFKYDYDKKFKENQYEYVVVRVTVNYMDFTGKNIADAYFESTFRYNPSLNISKCLSTSHRQNCSDSKYAITLNCRTKNLSMATGESFGKVTLRKMMLPKDKAIYIFSCDSDGNLSRRTL